MLVASRSLANFAYQRVGMKLSTIPSSRDSPIVKLHRFISILKKAWYATHCRADASCLLNDIGEIVEQSGMVSDKRHCEGFWAV